MLTNIDKLILELYALKEQYNITVKEKDCYGPYGDCGDVYQGTDQYFVIDGEQYYVKTVEEVIREVFSSADLD